MPVAEEGGSLADRYEDAELVRRGALLRVGVEPPDRFAESGEPIATGQAAVPEDTGRFSSRHSSIPAFSRVARRPLWCKMPTAS